MGVQTVYRWVRDHPFPVDLALSLLLLLFLWVGTGAMVGAHALLMVVQVLPLAIRRVEPFTAALLVAAGCLAQVVLTSNPLGSNIAVLIVIYSAAAHAQERWKSFTVLGLGLGGSLLAAADWVWGSEWAADRSSLVIEFMTLFVVLVMLVSTAWVLGDVVRRRKAVVARLREQNEALARDQTQREALAASGERASIAREMHDIVAHSLSVVVVQADGGAYAARAALGREPGADADRRALDQAAQTLETLAATAREALTDTRRLVGVLRESGSAAEYRPAQGLDHLEDLVQRLRDSGIPVDLSVRGGLAGLSRDLDLAAYRVVQESLTNVLKHAGRGATASVDVLHTPAVLLVRVTDDGAGRGAGDGKGNGIIGMRERVEVLGGTLYAGPRTAGGFEVVASLPIQPAGGRQDPPSIHVDGAGRD